jgi:hypothetical protein
MIKRLKEHSYIEKKDKLTTPTKEKAMHDSARLFPNHPKTT